MVYVLWALVIQQVSLTVVDWCVLNYNSVVFHTGLATSLTRVYMYFAATSALDVELEICLSLIILYSFL